MKFYQTMLSKIHNHENVRTQSNVCCRVSPIRMQWKYTWRVNRHYSNLLFTGFYAEATPKNVSKRLKTTTEEQAIEYHKNAMEMFKLLSTDI